MYYITICAYNRENIFGKIILGSVKTDPYVKLNELGKIVDEELINISKRMKYMKIKKKIIMPNHIHFIIEINVGVGLDQPLNKMKLPQIIGLYKSGVTRIFHQKYKNNMKIWQRNYYEHIIKKNVIKYVNILKIIQLVMLKKIFIKK